MLTRTPLRMLDAKGTPDSDVTFDGKEVVVKDLENSNKRGVRSGSYDDTTGTITLVLDSGDKLQITGFATSNSMGTGAVGPTGPKGDDGVVMVFIQTADPAAMAVPGALWIKP